MKTRYKILIVIALLAAGLGFAHLSKAQTAPADSLLEFPIIVQDAYFEIASLPDGSPIIEAIWKAVTVKMQGMSLTSLSQLDSSEYIYPVISQSEVILVANNNRLIIEGVGAEVNGRLSYTAFGLTENGKRPWMRAQLLAIRATNIGQFNSRAAEGKAILQKKMSTWSRVAP